MRRLARLGDAGTATPTGTFVRDFDSSLTFADLPYDSADPSTRYPPDERAAIDALLDDALDALAPFEARAFVQAQLDRVLLRRFAASGRAASSSNRDHVGVAVLADMERADDRIATCAEALLHESIHQFLYREEAVHGAPCSLDARRRFRSPWSGNRIPLHSLVHATYVYFGLLAFWCGVAEGHRHAAFARDRIARIVFGFAWLPELLAAPTFPRDDVAPAALAAIARMAESARAFEPPVHAHATVRAALDADRKWSASLREASP